MDREEFRLQRVSVMRQVSDDLLTSVTEHINGQRSQTDLYNDIEVLFTTEWGTHTDQTFAINTSAGDAWKWFKAKIKAGIDKIDASSKPRVVADWLGTVIVNGALVAASNDDRTKMWLSRRDPKVRPTHVEADGQTVAWGEPFTVCGVEMMFPGEPVGDPDCFLNCRCVAANPDVLTASLQASATKGKTSFTPPAGVKSAAQRALVLIKEGKAGSGFTDTGRARAAQLAGGGAVSRTTIKRMNAYFSRHKGDKKPGWGKKGEETPGYVAWLAWGGDPGAAWSRKMVRSFEAEAALLTGEEEQMTDATLTDEDVAAFAATVEEEDDMPPTDDDMPDEELPSDEEILEEDDDEEDDTDFTIIPDRIPWKGILAPEGIRSGDGRKFSLGALTHRDLPLPLRVQEADIGGHDGAITVGTIDNIWRDENNMVWGSGDFIDLDLADKVVGQIMDGALKGVSIDADDAEMAAESDENEVEFSKARICAATLVAIPAFQEAYVQLGAPDEVDSSYGKGVDTGDGESVAASGQVDGRGSLLAVGGVEVLPEEEWDFARLHFGGGQGQQETSGASCRLGKYAGSNPSGPDRGSSVQEHGVLQSSAYGVGDGSGEHASLQRGACFVAAGNVWVWAPVRGRQRTDGDAPKEGWFHLSGADLSGVQAHACAENAAQKTRAVGRMGLHATPSREASSEFKRGPGWVTHPKETRTLHRYWTKGKGAAKIGWGTPGSFRRARRALAKYIPINYLNRTVAQWYHDATGTWPGVQRGDKGKGLAAAAINLVAAAPDMLPAKFFKNPMLEGPTAITVDEGDHIYGHLALWGTCHIGIQNACTTAPHSQQDYAYFRTGAVLTDEGYISVGQITMGTGHADLHANPSQTAAHYDNTGFVVADVVVGEDKFGIWFSGMTRRGISKNDMHTLIAGALSGDWRRISGNLELVAALVVNVPGFPVPRPALAASGVGQQSLVAAGVSLPQSAGDDLDEFVRVVEERLEARASRRLMVSGLVREMRVARVEALKGEVL